MEWKSELLWLEEGGGLSQPQLENLGFTAKLRKAEGQVQGHIRGGQWQTQSQDLSLEVWTKASPHPVAPESTLSHTLASQAGSILSHPFMASLWERVYFPALQMGKLRVMEAAEGHEQDLIFSFVSGADALPLQSH